MKSVDALITLEPFVRTRIFVKTATIIIKKDRQSDYICDRFPRGLNHPSQEPTRSAGVITVTGRRVS